MNQVFRDNDLNNNFQRDGYVLLKRQIPQDAVGKIARFRETHPMYVDRAFTSTNYSDDPGFRRQVFDVMDAEITPRLADVLQDYVGVSAAFLVKKARQQGRVGLHIDWQLVEEPDFIGLNVWMPLVKAHRWNGTLQVIPRSHSGNPMFRGPNYIVPQRRMRQPDKLEKYAVRFNTAPGDLVIYDNRLLHFSGRNYGWRDRPAISFLMAPETSQLVHYYFEPNGSTAEQKVRKYKVDRNFYIEHCRFRQEGGVYQLSDGLPEAFEYVDEENRERFARGVQYLDSAFR